MDKAKKKHIKRYITWGAMALLVVLLAVMPLLAKSEAEADGPVASVLSTTVETGTVSSSLRGGGTLTADGAENVKIPSGVKITGFLVKNGDMVTAGTPLATVDKVSVMTAITEVTETLEYLQEELQDARDDTISSTITATAGGRVKKIFAQEGEAVQDVMLRDGALAVLSLDGLMAVKIERKMDILTGESVTVYFPDNTEVTGRVESNLDGVIVITVEDEGYTIGENVTVTMEDGTRLGAGQLYIHNAWKATAFSGTISAVNTKEERTVSSGATLFTLKDTDYTGEMEHRANQHREYEELLQELFQMYESGVITAPCDGEVSGVDKDSAHLLSSVPDSWEIAPLTNVTTEGEEKGWTVMLLGTTIEADPEAGGEGGNDDVTCEPGESCPVSANGVHEDGCIMACDRNEDCDSKIYHHSDCIKSCNTKANCQATGQHYKECTTNCKHANSPDKCSEDILVHHNDCIRGCINGSAATTCSNMKHYLTCIESCTPNAGTDCPATGAHKQSCIRSCIHADITGVCPATDRHYTDCIGACENSTSADKTCPSSKHLSTCYFYSMTYQATAAKVDAVGSSALVVFYDASGQIYDVQRTSSGWNIVSGQFSEQLLVGEGKTVSVSDPSKFSEGDIILMVVGYKGTVAAWSDTVVYKKGTSSPASTDMSSMMSGMMSGMSGMSISGMTGGLSGYGSYSGTTTTQSESLFDLEGSVLMTVTPRDTMTLTISVDEHDISKVSHGNKATVKVEALRGETFDAEVTGIAISGTNNGGSSKFSVELTLDVAENMLEGMSATAMIPIETKEDVLILPLEALIQEGAKTMVCTALDKDTGNPTSPVEVQTGLSDGENVEILSGLNEGDTVYYSYYDTLELDTSAQASKYSFG